MTQTSYLQRVRNDLKQSVLALDPLPTTAVLRPQLPIRPLVEIARPELVQEPILIKKNQREQCFIERSSNSIRCSFRLKQEDADPIEEAICHKFMRFLMQRAENYVILRRKPIQGYSISFLVMNTHVHCYSVDSIVDFVIHFLSQVDSEISNLKISMNARSRLVANEFMKGF